jgi:hypothetical protein
VRLLGRWFTRLLRLQRQVQQYRGSVGVDPTIPELQIAREQAPGRISAGVYRDYERYQAVTNVQVFLIVIDARRYLTFENDTNNCTACSK